MNYTRGGYAVLLSRSICGSIISYLLPYNHLSLGNLEWVDQNSSLGAYSWGQNSEESGPAGGFWPKVAWYIN